MVRGDSDGEPEAGMQIILIFAALFLGLNAIAVGICSIIEAYSSYVSLICFLGLFILNVLIAWKVALYITERFLLTQAQRDENERLSEALKSPYGFRS
jgi:membrane protein implicated in regulation of membrane protease activity